MAYNMQKIREEVPEAHLTQLLELRQQKVAELMGVVQRGIYQVDYRGLANRIIFWLFLERHRLNLEGKSTEKKLGQKVVEVRLNNGL